MSLLQDLESLDLTAIVNARGSISASVSAPQVQAILKGGAASSALGGLGGNLQSLQATFPSPEALLRPVVDAVEGLGVHFDIQRLPVPAFAEAVREGANIAGRIMSMAGSNPSDFGQIFGTSLGDVLNVVQSHAGELGAQVGAHAGAFGEMIRLVDGNANLRNPQAIAELAAGILLPFPKASLTGLRDGVQLVLSAAGEISLPKGRLSGILGALDAVTLAAERGDAAAVEIALRRLRDARAQTIATLQGDLRFAIEQIDRLRIPQLLNPLVQLSNTLNLGEQGAIEFLDDFRKLLVHTRAHIENFNLDEVRAFLRGLPDILEANGRRMIETPVNQAVERAKEEVRKLFRHLPVRDLRDELTQFLHNAALEIQKANLDGPANAARDALATVAGALNSGGLVGEIQEALQEVNGVISGALDGVISPLETIATEVDRLAGQAQTILDRLAAGLGEFQKSITALQVAIDGLGIEQTEAQIVESLQELRRSAEELLSNVPLPEPLRPQVEQLIELLQGIDFDKLMKPARDVAAELKVPPDVSTTVKTGLQRAKEVIENLIPKELIDSITKEVDDALSVIRNFNPASLLPDVTGFLNQAADAVERLDPRPVAQQIRPPFQTVLDLIDRAHPRTLLAPVIDAYDSVLGRIPVPDPKATSTSVLQAFNTVGNVAGRGVVAPIRHLDPDGNMEIADPSQPKPPTAELPPKQSEVHPGDAIRLLGYLPAKVREILKALDAGPAGEALRAIDGLCAGLARQLRKVQSALYEIQRRLDSSFEEMLLLLGPAQMRAQVALNAKFAGQANFRASLDVVALVGPSSLRAELQDSVNAVRVAARRAAAHAGGSVAASIERAATALESSPLSSLTTDLDRLLAALDPEPIAAEMDAIVNLILERAPQLMKELLADARAFVSRFKAILGAFNPGAQAQKFLAVLDVLRDEIDLFNPARLADELAEIHASIRRVVAAYDPVILAEELFAVVKAVAAQLRGLDPATLLGDLTFLQTTVDRLAQANPAKRLQGVGASLQVVGERLAEIDIDALIESVNKLGPRLIDSFGHALDAIRDEIIALLESLKFATGSASVSVSASASLG